MEQFQKLVSDIFYKGESKPPSREGMPPTKSLFGKQMDFDLREGFPITSTKQIPFRWVLVELLWFLNGDTNIQYLQDEGVTKMWHDDSYNFHVRKMKVIGQEPFSKEDFNKALKDGIEKTEYSTKAGFYKLGDCGNQYGRTWRNFGCGGFFDNVSIDQISRSINTLRTNPYSRRNLVVSNDVAADSIDDLSLYWCHTLFQFNVSPKSDTDSTPYWLDCKMYQRSADTLLGVPYNTASYALLMHIMAKMSGLNVRYFYHSFGDSHIYADQFDTVEEILNNKPRTMPDLMLEVFDDLIDWENATIDEVVEVLGADTKMTAKMILEGYDPHKPIDINLSTGTGKL